jgi:hypothetical protein
VEFHSYANQDEHKHAEFDTRDAFEEESLSDNPDVVHVGRPLREFYERQAGWDAVKPYFECVFAVADPNTKALAASLRPSDPLIAVPRGCTGFVQWARLVVVWVELGSFNSSGAGRPSLARARRPAGACGAR